MSSSVVVRPGTILFSIRSASIAKQCSSSAEDRTMLTLSPRRTVSWEGWKPCFEALTSTRGTSAGGRRVGHGNSRGRQRQRQHYLAHVLSAAGPVRGLPPRP